MFLTLTFRDAQAQGAFGRSDWLQNLESVVMSNFISVAHSNNEAIPHVEPTPRELSCFGVIGLLGVTLYRDQLTGHKSLQEFFRRQPETEAAVMRSVINAGTQITGAHAGKVQDQAQPVADLQHVHELPAATLELPRLERALDPLVGSLQQQLLEEGYDTTNWEDLRRLRTNGL